ncbi:MAG TPA: AbrB/MazE/SpoVT family DNA-binding domain-containing protein [Blastocatellia bacterium]|nr:AbrB/MazE/SpoVT family DNA-binding domain-containing protein [Blastocatellia bacterium]
MAKVTSKLQVTIPKAIAHRYGIRPGDDIEWTPAGEAIRVLPHRPPSQKNRLSLDDRLGLFDQATERQRHREAHPEEIPEATERPWKPHEIERGWRREDIYDRGRTR